MAQHRTRRNPDGRPEAQGEADRRDPVLRQPGDADRPHHRCRWRVGTGYSYTIGTGGPSVMALLERTLAPALIGREARRDRAHLARPPVPDPRHHGRRHHLARARRHRHGAVGPEVPPQGRAAAAPAWPAARRRAIPLYTTEGGWLHLETAALVEDALRAKADGLRRLPRSRSAGRIHEDVARLVGGARGGRRRLRDLHRRQPGLHRRRGDPPGARLRAARHRLVRGAADRPTTSTAMSGCRSSTSIPIAVGESLYSHLHFREYLERRRLLDRAGRRRRAIGGITPWLKVAHLAETLQRRRSARIS